MITLHHLNNSRSQRILWMLEESGLAYQIQHYQRDAETNLAPPELAAIHPLGKAPILVDEENVLVESAIILQYLSKKSNKFAVSQKGEYWLHFSEGSLMPFLLLSLIFGKIKQAPLPFFLKPVTKKIANKVLKPFVEPSLKKMVDFIERHLAENDWFDSEFSIADIQMSFPLEAAMARQAVKEEHVNIKKWLDKIHARAAYQQGLEKGGPYDYA